MADSSCVIVSCVCPHERPTVGCGQQLTNPMFKFHMTLLDTFYNNDGKACYIARCIGSYH